MNRIGEIRENNKGNKMKIIYYNNAHDIIVEFQDKYNAKVHTSYKCFKRGEVKNPYCPNVYDVGYLGEGKYNRKEYEVIYRVWISMISRCYNPYYINEYPTYIDCYVCKE